MSELRRQKRLLRQQARDALAGLSPARQATNSRDITAAVAAIPGFREAKSVFISVARPPEVQTEALIAQLLRSGREVSVPLIVDVAAGSEMRSAVITDVGQLEPGRFGIMSPPADSKICRAPDVAIVPGLAFDRSGGRLGQGAGYYDHWFATNPKSRRMAVAHSVQLLQQAPMEQHDARMHCIVTEHGPIWVEA